MKVLHHLRGTIGNMLCHVGFKEANMCEFHVMCCLASALSLEDINQFEILYLVVHFQYFLTLPWYYCVVENSLHAIHKLAFHQKT